MIPMCGDLGVGLVPYSPNGKGRLTRPRGQTSDRANLDEVARAFDSDLDGPIIDAVHTLAGQRGVPMAAIALAWVLRNPTVSAAVIGATKPAHMIDAVAALDLELTGEEVSALEAPYSPQEPFWW